MTGRAEVEALLATIDAAASGFTLCRVAPGMRLAGAASAGVSVLQVLHGTMRLDLPDGGRLVAPAGQLVLLPGGTRPLMACQGDTPRRTVDGRECLARRGGWLVADATGGRDAALVVAAARMTGTTERSLGGVLAARLADLAEGRQALAMLRAEVARSTAGSTTLAVTLMSACIVIGLRIAMTDSARAVGGRSPDRRASIERTIAAIQQRPADPHDVISMARTAGMSRATLTRYFRTVLQTTPSAFVQKARLTEAAALLRSTDLPIKVVAATAGFASRSHFSRAFAAAHGADPSNYRRLLTRDKATDGI